MITPRRYFFISLVLLLAAYSCGKERSDYAGPGCSSPRPPWVEKNMDMGQFTGTVLDLNYAGSDNKRQTLDIIYPSVGKAPYRTIAVFHGGGWRSGNKQSETLMHIFQATTQGYAVVSVNYRLSDEVTWPKPLHDAKAAIRFIRASGEKYRLDTRAIVVWGASAGGHIAEMLAATNGLPEFEDQSMGNMDVSSAVQGVVSWYGVSDMSTLTGTGIEPAGKIMGFDVTADSEKTAGASPVKLVSGNFPPILLVHGTVDRVVPYSQSVEMRDRVNEATGNRTAELVTYKGAAHGDPVINSTESVSENLYFVDRVLYGGKNPFRNKKYIEIRIIR